MRKSPFSTPRGNGHPNFGWKSGGSSGRGYARVKNFTVYTPNHSDNSSSPSFGDDYIPFSPSQSFSTDRQSSGNWSSPGGNWQTPTRGNYRNWTSPASTGFNNYRNSSPRENNRASPRYKNGGNHYRGNHKNFHRGNKRGKADLSHYVNLKWFLEDPWALLTQRLKATTDVTGDSERAASDLTLDSSRGDSLHSDYDTEQTSLVGQREFQASPLHLPDPKNTVDPQD